MNPSLMRNDEEGAFSSPDTEDMAPIYNQVNEGSPLYSNSLKKQRAHATPDINNQNFFVAYFDRAIWLAGLLIFQSCSSFILARYEQVLKKHTTIIYFLTALVGAGGNAVNQASVRCIRGLALRTLNASTMRAFLCRELAMAVLLSITLGLVGFVRALLSPCTTTELIAIVLSLITIVFVSIILGALLPLFLNFLGFDPAHASTTIQVLMDISGVFITMLIASALLDTSAGQNVLTNIGVS